MKKVRATGIGVHASDEIIQMGKDDLQVLTEMLGEKPFFFGDQPSIVRIWKRVVNVGQIVTIFFLFFHQLDLVVFSNIAQVVVVDKEVAHPFRDWVMENGKNLVQHFEKIKEKLVGKLLRDAQPCVTC